MPPRTASPSTSSSTPSTRRAYAARRSRRCSHASPPLPTSASSPPSSTSTPRRSSTPSRPLSSSGCGTTCPRSSRCASRRWATSRRWRARRRTRRRPARASCSTCSRRLHARCGLAPPGACAWCWTTPIAMKNVCVLRCHTQLCSHWRRRRCCRAPQHSRGGLWHVCA